MYGFTIKFERFTDLSCSPSGSTFDWKGFHWNFAMVISSAWSWIPFLDSHTHRPDTHTHTIDNVVSSCLHIKGATHINQLSQQRFTQGAHSRHQPCFFEGLSTSSSKNCAGLHNYFMGLLEAYLTGKLISTTQGVLCFHQLSDVIDWYIDWPTFHLCVCVCVCNSCARLLRSK